MDNTAPLTDMVDYCLQQVDKDGSYSFTAIRSIKVLTAGKAFASVFPNPVSATKNFKLEYTALKSAVAAPTGMSGRVLLTQTFKNIQAGTLTKITLPQKVAAGVYVLQLTGNNLSEGIKVVVR